MPIYHQKTQAQAPDNELGVMDINANGPNQRSIEDIVSNKYGQLLLNFRINTGFKIAIVCSVCLMLVT